jgi:hypothetical protein
MSSWFVYIQWKGGRRDPYKVTTPAKTSSELSDNAEIKEENHDPTSTNWVCQCGSEVPATKSRCGKCHHWRGGKRKGGWTIRPSSNSPNDYGIDWTADWVCCEEVISANKRRCGKCNRWRGGKRVAKASLTSGEGDVSIVYEATAIKGEGDASMEYEATTINV